MDKIKKKAVKGIKWTALSAASSVGIQVLRTLVLARMLEPRDYGLMGMLMVAVGFADAFCDAGLTGGIVHRQTSDRKVLSSLFWTSVVLGIVVYAVLAISTPALVWYFKEPVLLDLAMVLFSAVVFRSLGRQFEAVLIKDLKFKELARIEILSGMLSLGIAILCAFYGLGVWALVWSHVSKIGIQAFLQIITNWKELRPALHFRWGDVRPFVRFGLFQLGEMNIRYFAQRFDQLLLARFLGAGPLGLYNFANQLVILPTSRINPVVTRVAFPVFAKFKDDAERLQKLYIQAIRLLTFINAPLLAAVAVFAPFYVPTLFGTKWAESIPLVQAFSVVAFSRSIGNPIGSLMLAKGRSDLGFFLNVGLMCLNIPSIYLGIHFFGAIGAIFGLLLAQLILNVPVYLFVIRRLIGPCGEVFTKAWSIPLLYALIAGFLGLVVSHSVEDSVGPIGALCAGLVIYGGTYLGVLWKYEPHLKQQLADLKSGKSN